MGLAALEGFTIGVTADRRADEQIELLVRRGATVVRGPTIGTAYLGDERAIEAATRSLIADPPDLLVANTGIGMRSWFEAAQTWDLDEQLVGALGDTVVVARGPKAAGAAQRAGLRVDHHAVSERLSEVREMLMAVGVAGRSVAVQLHGVDHMPLIDDLEAAGAAVRVIPVYRWNLPDDRDPALRLIEAVCERRVDALTFTSAPAISNLLEIADGAGRRAELLGAINTGVVAACVGPVCADAARELGILAPVAPDVGRMGNLVRVLTAALQARRRTFHLGGHEMVLQGSTVEIDGEPVVLSPRERAVFDVLTENPGIVLPKADLERRVWGDTSQDSHRLHVNMGRLRQRLGPAGGAIEPVYGRGYRLNATAT
jgi:uroporphyrinogen-III synthase